MNISAKSYLRLLSPWRDARQRELERIGLKMRSVRGMLMSTARRYALSLVSWSIAQGDRHGFSDTVRDRLSRAGLTSRQAQEGFLLVQEAFAVAGLVGIVLAAGVHVGGVFPRSVEWFGAVLLICLMVLLPQIWIWMRGRRYSMRSEVEIPCLITVLRVMRQSGIAADEEVVETFGRYYGDRSAHPHSFARHVAQVAKGITLGMDWRDMLMRGVPRDMSPSMLPSDAREFLQLYGEEPCADSSYQVRDNMVQQCLMHIRGVCVKRLRMMRHMVIALCIVGAGGIGLLFV